MDPFVRLMYQLQQSLKSCGQETLSFPPIILLGEQSHGKSSLVESIIGESFLPKGAAIATRRPLQIHIVPNEETGNRHCSGVFGHDIKKLNRGLNEIREEILAETINRSGKKKISAEPIVLKLFTNKVPPMTLVDLPGIVKPSTMDHPQEMEKVSRDIAVSYVRRANSIILAVTAANTDISKSEGLKLANEVDPEGERTIAVITKLDQIDSGKDLSDVLEGQVIKAKLGVFGVMNRFRQNTLEGRKTSVASKDEEEFFRRNYPKIANRHGSQQLALFIRELLMTHIETCLPEIKDRFRNLAQQHEHAMIGYGEKVTDVNQTVFQILNRFATHYVSTISGIPREAEIREIKGGAKISYIFHELFSTSLKRIDPMHGLEPSAIRLAIRNCAGVKPLLFIPETCIENLVKKQIQLLEPPCITCVQLIKEEMIRLIHTSPHVINQMSRFPKLGDAIIQVTSEFITTRAIETDKMVRNVVRIHSSYINTAHPDFVREKERLVTEIRRLSNQSQVETIIVGRLITAYFNTVRRAVDDAVPKSIMHCLVNHVTDKLLNELVDKLLNEMQSYGMLEESHDIVQKRRESQRALDELQKATKVIRDLENCNRLASVQASSISTKSGNLVK